MDTTFFVIQHRNESETIELDMVDLGDYLLLTYGRQQ